MAVYSYDPIFATDPSNPENVASNASITIFDPADVNKNPIAITDVTGSPLPNPITVNKSGFGPAFQHPTLDRVGWSGGGFSNYFTSYEGLKNVAVEAAADAQTAAATAGAQAAAVATAAIGTATGASTAAAASAATAATSATNAATAAANAAALVGAPADTAIAAAVSGNGATKAALSATYAGKSVEASVAGKLDATAAAATYAPVAKPDALPSLAVVTKPYDKALSVYNLRPAHLRRFRAALAKAVNGTGLCRIGFAGDSITIGKGINRNKESWPVRLRERLVATGVPDGGDGFVFGYAGDAGLDPRFVASGATPWNKGALTIHGLQAGSTVGSTLTFTSDKPGTVIEILYSNAVAGAFSVTIDGAANTTITASGANTYGTHTVTGLANTTHTVVLTSTAGAPSIAGIGVRQATGLVVDNGGISGSKAGEWNTQAFYNYGPVTRLLAPNLVFIALGTNDLAYLRTVEQYKTDMHALITRYTNTDIVLIAQIPGNNIDWTAYRGVLYELANELDLPLIDLHDQWGSYTIANGLGLLWDAWHPNAAGAATIARAVGKVVS